MKQIIISLTSILLLASCNNDVKVKSAETVGPKNTDLLSQNLKGKVQRIEGTSFTLDANGKMGAPDSTIAVDEFDQKGYETKYTSKDKDGNIKEQTDYIHFENGQMKAYELRKNGKLMDKMNIEIDSNGKYNYAERYDSNGKMSSFYKDLTENEYGQVLSGTEYNPDRSFKSSMENSYQGAVFIGTITKDSSRNENYRSSIKLNDKNDPAEETTMTVTKDITKNETKTYQYDDFDEKGNWTKRTTYNEKGKPVKILKRTISYYKD